MQEIEKARELINEKFVIAQTAPSLKTALGEPFGIKSGTFVGGKLVTALYNLGFKRVFGTDFGAELRIMEEAAELKERLDSGKNLPLLTSCCPSWVGICVKKYPKLVKYLSTCKSPMEMVSSLSKSYLIYEKALYGEIGVAAIMPCYAKKMEVKRGQTDVVLTAMELVQWMKEDGINFKSLPDGTYDSPLGMCTSAGTVYASTGGVSESTLRTFYALYTNDQFKKHLYKEEIIADGIRRAKVRAGDYKIKIAMIEGPGGIDSFCRGMLDGDNRDYDLVEVMFCPGGCVGGNGMPNAGQQKYISARIGALKEYDRRALVKSAHENPLVQEIYSLYLGEPFGKKAQEILHVKDFNVMFG
ncbi:MAG: iron hydrogenase small subunit [Candidatus Altiarchaeota archaeon]|nr:iron hydrogenase small subunit [Candidatus Altiarchaeota archaeon]